MVSKFLQTKFMLAARLVRRRAWLPAVKEALIMRTAISLLIVLFAFNFVAVARGQTHDVVVDDDHVVVHHHGGGGRGGQSYGKAKTAAHKTTTITKSENDIPKAEIKTIDVPDSIEWDFMLWTDASGNHQVRGKVLSIDGKEVRLEKEGGAILKIAIEKFCKADRELLTAAYEAESLLPKKIATRFKRKSRKQCRRILRRPALGRLPYATSRKRSFWKQTTIGVYRCQFPVADIRPADSPGCYRLRLEAEETMGGDNYGGWHDTVKLSPSEAAWVSKGDKLIISGKAQFQFGRGRKSSTKNYFYYWGNPWGKWGPNVPYLHFNAPVFRIIRIKHDSSLNDKIKAPRCRIEGYRGAFRGSGW